MTGRRRGRRGTSPTHPGRPTTRLAVNWRHYLGATPAIAVRRPGTGHRPVRPATRLHRHRGVLPEPRRGHRPTRCACCRRACRSSCTSGPAPSTGRRRSCPPRCRSGRSPNSAPPCAALAVWPSEATMSRLTLRLEPRPLPHCSPLWTVSTARGCPVCTPRCATAARCGAARPGSPMSTPAGPSRPTCGSGSAASPRPSPPPRSCSRSSKGRIQLDAPIGRYLPQLVPGERGDRSRSGCCSTTPAASPSTSPMRSRPSQAAVAVGRRESLDDNRFTAVPPGRADRDGARGARHRRAGRTPGCVLQHQLPAARPAPGAGDRYHGREVHHPRCHRARRAAAHRVPGPGRGSTSRTRGCTRRCSA